MIISLTTIPSRLPHIEPVINSLTHQTIQCPVHVWIPKECTRLNQIFDGKIPKFLKHRLVRYEVIKDVGPVSKLYYAIDKDQEFITVDDDVSYGPLFTAGFMKWKQKLNGALCYRGRQLTNGKYETSVLFKGNGRGVSVDIVTGTWGVYYRSEWFKDFKPVERFRMVDDIVISGHLKNKGIGMFAIPLHTPIKPLPELYSKDDLFRHNRNHRNNNEAIKNLL